MGQDNDCCGTCPSTALYLQVPVDGVSRWNAVGCDCSGERGRGVNGQVGYGSIDGLFHEHCRHCSIFRQMDPSMLTPPRTRFLLRFLTHTRSIPIEVLASLAARSMHPCRTRKSLEGVQIFWTRPFTCRQTSRNMS